MRRITDLRENARFIAAVLSQKRYLLLAGIASASFLGLVLWLTNIPLMLGNLGTPHTILYLALSGIVVILFGVYISLFVYRFREKQTFGRAGAVGVIGTGANVLVTGCAACSITLASYLGLASVFAALPWYGLELNVLGAGLMSVAIFSLSKPAVCKVRR